MPTNSVENKLNITAVHTESSIPITSCWHRTLLVIL